MDAFIKKLQQLVTKFETKADVFLTKVLINPLNKASDKLEDLGKEKSPAKFEFRYNKVTEEFVTVPIDEVVKWDKEYKKALKKAKLKA